MTSNVSLVVYVRRFDSVVGLSIGVFRFPIQLYTLV